MSFTAALNTSELEMTLCIARSRRAVSTYLTPRRRILLQKLTIPHLAHKFPAFFCKRKIHSPIRKCLLLAHTLSNMKPIYDTENTSLRYTLILSYHLRLHIQSGFFPLTCSLKTLHEPLISPHTGHVHRPSSSSRLDNRGKHLLRILRCVIPVVLVQ